ncbi:Hemerythrin HHE cation binding domain-containing protein [Streptomyces melanosporofaciens]|uniref:Hemerythrin HHE cation binding domain-containing protein n=1 Tax=Streptomyces melanosporofaciens TaxID=67327 RepID=A0A1H4MQL5_STRMJ|nr:Hemerythrin HHE cation binding domain-containing protein [Streptomyces melanosporofaciens]
MAVGHGGDVINELTTDHREVDALFEEIQAATPGNSERKRLLDQLTIELVRHSVAEEQYLYPAIRRRLAGGDAIADKEIADHSRVEQLLKDLEERGADAADFDVLVTKLKTEVTSHVRDEEQNLFVQLRQACDADELHELGEKIRHAKKTAPTRPHPSAPDTPPSNKILAPGTGLVDRARDFVTGRGK